MIAWALITILGDPVHKLELNLWAHWGINAESQTGFLDLNLYLG